MTGGLSGADLDAIKEAEVRAGLDWNLDNAHPLLMAIGPLLAELRADRAARQRVEALCWPCDVNPDYRSHTVTKIRAALRGEQR